jgi:hypothetical protein
MDPYRAPQDAAERPRDPMRVVLIIAGAIAALIALPAVVMLWQEHQEAVASAPAGSTPRERRVAPVTGNRFAFEVHSTTCFGDCWPYFVSIDESALIAYRVTGDVRGRTVTCTDMPTQHASADALAVLVSHAKAMHLESLKAYYPPQMTDHAELETVVVADGRRYAIKHPDEIGNHEHPSAEEQRVQSLIDLHDEISKVAKVDAWSKHCKLVAPRIVDPGPPTGDLKTLLDTR